MDDVVIGLGKLSGKGVYANRGFKKGEMVMKYNLKELGQEEFNSLPIFERMFTHSFWGRIYLYPEPARNTNHSAKPNTVQDLKNMCDFATRDIKKGEMITTNATVEIENELKTFLEVYEGHPVKNLEFLKKGYRNSILKYTAVDIAKTLTLKRIDGNWQTIEVNIN